ncbi:MAG: phenylalanine--tRNA ligase subunit beta [Verrucomicrobiota bacterium]|nr:phenylalanine--tRNA ligase subunit beta [Verrucomicrobiota bacterium]
MKLPLSLLKSFISIDLDPEKIAETLTLLGIEVESIHTPHPPFHHVVVAEIKSVQPHPAANKLQVAQVFDGTHTYQVVCGAPNCRPHLRVALAQVGATLTDSAGTTRKIEQTAIRGVESLGMLCSAGELNLYEPRPKGRGMIWEEFRTPPKFGCELPGPKGPGFRRPDEDDTGILELPPEMPLGADCLPLLWDPVFELSLTPNLGHCMSALGIARELSAALQIPLATAKTSSKKPTKPSSIKVSVRDVQLVPRYMARLIENIHVAPSPFWLQKQLRSAGLRPINNIVDATNYILLKYGGPLHAFDAEKVEKLSIEVSSAPAAFSFEGLNETTIEVPPGTLLISDAKKPIALAGILGGANSSVTDTTRSILLEAACFDPIAIRIASKKMGLRTDSSLRFEKGIDASTIPLLLEEAVQLILDLAGGTASSKPIDETKKDFAPRALSFRPERANQLLGTKLSDSEIKDLLHRLQFNVKKKGAAWLVEVPLYRNDIQEEIDLIEEVARLYGYNNIDCPLPKATTPQIPDDKAYLFETDLRRRLHALGLQEFLTCDLISPKLAEIAQETSLQENTLLQTLHSKSEDYSILRPSLLPGLLQVTRSNLDQKNNTFHAFELGRIHFLQENKPIEFLMAALLLTGKEMPHHWDRKPQDVDFFELKGLIENLLTGLRLRFSITPSDHLSFHPGRQANVFLGPLCIGCFGEIHPSILAKLDIKQRVYYAELNAHHLQQHSGEIAKMAPLPQFPSSERDWTLSLDPAMNIAEFFTAADSIKPPLLEKFELIDLFRAPNKNNITFRFTYRDRSKTISFEEVEQAHTHFVQQMSQLLSKHIR